jgi:hypothetical protein
MILRTIGAKPPHVPPPISFPQKPISYRAFAFRSFLRAFGGLFLETRAMAAKFVLAICFLTQNDTHEKRQQQPTKPAPGKKAIEQ